MINDRSHTCTIIEMTEGSSSSGGQNNSYLVWQDLTVVAATSRSRSKVLLDGVSGYAQPHRMMALMGPSGSGKSTLLDALAGRSPANVKISGDVILNGNKRCTNSRDIAYVTHEDVFLGSLTVRETLTYSANLRLPTKMTKEGKIEVVEETLTKMGLQLCADTHIGNWHLRGISNGEKRRLSICIEILTQPHLLLFDEPTSGLDSASSFFVIWALKNIAHDGRIVICSIHQPSSDVFNLFNDLVLLAGGETVYFGDAQKALRFFSDAGFPCPTRKNPPEHYLRCISSDFDKAISTLILSQILNHASSNLSTAKPNLTTDEIKGKLMDHYKSSNFSTDAKKRMKELLLSENTSEKSNKGSGVSSWQLLCTLMSRASLNMSRDIGYYWLRGLFYILIAVSAGSFFFHIGTGNHAIAARGKSNGFIFGLMICLSIGGVPFFIEELKVFRRERLGGHYGEALFTLCNFLSSLPFVVAMAFSSGTILYYMVKFHTGFSNYLYFCINLFGCIAVTEGSALFVAALVPNLLMAILGAAALTVFMMMPSLVFRRVSDIPNFFWKYPMSYLSYVGWATEGQFKNDMIGIEFDPPVQGAPKLSGEVVLRETYGINPEISKWWNLAALACLLIGMRLFFYVALKYKERASLFFHSLYARQETRSFRKDQFISSSKRHRTLNPLSSQEDLGSPLP